MTTARKRVVKVNQTAPVLQIVDGEVKVVPPAVEEEIVVEEEVDSGKPKYRFQTPAGEAVYEYSGDCWDCQNEGKTTAVFHCITHPLRADEQLGDQLAAFWNDGAYTPICMRHHRQRLGQIQQVEPDYKVIESSKFAK